MLRYIVCYWYDASIFSRGYTNHCSLFCLPQVCDFEQVSLLAPDQDKFCQFLSATLHSLSLLLEVTAFADIGKVWTTYIYIMVQPCVSIQRLIKRVIYAFIHVFQHVEEILGYLQVCVKLEATKTLLCVQQVFINMLHHIFSYMRGQVFSSWRFRPSKSLPLPDRPHHDEFATSIITCSPAPFPVCPQIYNSFSHSRTCSFIRREK